MIINFKEEEHGSVGELSPVCSQIVLKCLFVARIGARAVTKWTKKTCDKRLARLISYTFITRVNTGNIVMWETQHNIAD